MHARQFKLAIAQIATLLITPVASFLHKPRPNASTRHRTSKSNACGKGRTCPGPTDAALTHRLTLTSPRNSPPLTCTDTDDPYSTTHKVAEYRRPPQYPCHPILPPISAYTWQRITPPPRASNPQNKAPCARAWHTSRPNAPIAQASHARTANCTCTCTARESEQPQRRGINPVGRGGRARVCEGCFAVAELLSRGAPVARCAVMRAERRCGCLWCDGCRRNWGAVDEGVGLGGWVVLAVM